MVEDEPVVLRERLRTRRAQHRGLAAGEDGQLERAVESQAPAEMALGELLPRLVDERERAAQVRADDGE